MAEGACLKVGDKEFCYSRKQKCPCSKRQKYSDHNKAKLATWDKYVELWGKKKKDPRHLKGVAKSAEHHHILCVGAIQTFLGLSDDAMRHARAVTWCINEAKNMILLPEWAMTLMHYCDLSSAEPSVLETRTTVAGGASVKSTTAEAPVFQNNPMHDFDHDLYIKEVDDELKQLADELALVDECQDPENGLKARLDGLSEKYHAQLLENGWSNGGTHGSWNRGIDDPGGNWYVAFSMSRDPRRRTHPSAGQYFDDDFVTKLKELHSAFWLNSSGLSPAV